MYKHLSTFKSAMYNAVKIGFYWYFCTFLNDNIASGIYQFNFLTTWFHDFVKIIDFFFSKFVSFFICQIF